MSYDYQTIRTRLQDGVLTATLDNPPINIITQQMFLELAGFVEEVSADDAVRVLVLESADPDFFIAHFDVSLIQTFPIDTPAEREEELNLFHVMCEGLRTMPKPTLAKIAGRVGGGGNEFVSNCDMRYGIAGKTVISQMEVALGILPGGCGTQQLPRLIGRSRAMEVILGADDLDARTAERWGYLNRVFESAAAMDDFVNRLAARMALWPPEALSRAKQSVLNAALPLEEGLREEAFLFQQTLRTEPAQTLMGMALESGAQTREGELRIADLCIEVAQKAKP